MKIPVYAKKAIEMIEQNFYEAYLVGGCVRDMVMGKIQNDIDITTNMLPDKIEELFCDYKTIDIGKKHGTITVFIENIPIEITTYRIESEYSDNRHPNNVSFTTSLFNDLSRRDFTMNALCYNDKSGLVDLFCGIEDINNKCIRAIGEPKKRFSEDALRIIRAFRFMAQLNFTIEESTKTAIYECRDLLKNISKERVTIELTKLLMSDNPLPALSLMNELCVLNNIIKPLNEQDKTALKKSNSILEIRLALALTEQSIEYICIDCKTKTKVKKLLFHKSDSINADKISIKKKLNQISYDDFLLLLDYKFALGEDMTEHKKLALEIKQSGECYSLSQLAINGDYLILNGIPKGKRIGEILIFLLNSVIDGKVENEKNSLLDFLLKQ